MGVLYVGANEVVRNVRAEWLVTAAECWVGLLCRIGIAFAVALPLYQTEFTQIFRLFLGFDPKSLCTLLVAIDLLPFLFVFDFVMMK